MAQEDSIDFEKLILEIFRKGGWRVRRHSAEGGSRADLLIDDGDKRYIVEVKSTSEGRRDRLVPLLSQAILQAQASSRWSPEPAAPLAVVTSRHIRPAVAEHLKQFAERHAPDVAIGVIDAEGFRSFVGPGLERLDAVPVRRTSSSMVSPKRLPALFSDLNQWMLKIVLGQRLPEQLISVPREKIRNASHLAGLAKVSVMSASRLIKQLSAQGFLDERKGPIQIARVEELLDLWIAANRQAGQNVPARWIIKGGPDQLLTGLQRYLSPRMHNQPKCCLGLFAAADVLGLGFVRGISPHLYLERVTLDTLNRLGLVVDHSGHPDVTIVIPNNRQTVFRPCVIRDGVPVADVLQVWLDVSAHPARGQEQAREIRRLVLKPIFERAK